MAYSERAKILRPCAATALHGSRCKAWAIWGDTLCTTHAGRTRGPKTPGVWKEPRKTRAVPCRCQAYRWPHRPGSGLCRWPDPPDFVSTVSLGTRAWWRKRGGRY